MKLDVVELTPRLKLLRLQFIEREDGVILKRGRTQIKICGEGSAAAIRELLAAAAEGATTREALSALFPAPARPAIEQLLGLLETKGFFVPVNGGETGGAPASAAESNLDVFYWHFQRTAQQVKKQFNAVTMTVLGVNCISRQLVAALAAAGADKVTVVNYPPLCNLRLFNDDGSLPESQWPASLQPPLDYQGWRNDDNVQPPQFIIATSDFGGQELLRPWNRFCVTRGIQFLPVILQDLIGYIGPLIIPSETACLECLRARQNSHMSDAATQRAVESAAWENQSVNGFHPSMASLLGDLAAIELTKFYGGLPGSPIVGRLIEVNLLATEVTTRKVFKIPRCPVCSPLNRTSPISTNRDEFMPGNEVVE